MHTEQLSAYTKPSTHPYTTTNKMNTCTLVYAVNAIIPFRHMLFSMLTATEVSTIVALTNTDCTMTEMKRYLNPLRDLGIHTNIIMDMMAKGCTAIIVGKDVHNWVERIRDPVGYWQITKGKEVFVLMLVMFCNLDGATWIAPYEPKYEGWIYDAYPDGWDCPDLRMFDMVGESGIMMMATRNYRDASMFVTMDTVLDICMLDFDGRFVSAYIRMNLDPYTAMHVLKVPQDDHWLDDPPNGVFRLTIVDKSAFCPFYLPVFSNEMQLYTYMHTKTKQKVERKMEAAVSRHGQPGNDVRPLIHRCDWGSLAATLVKDRDLTTRIFPDHGNTKGSHEKVMRGISQIEAKYFSELRRGDQGYDVKSKKSE